MAIARYKSYVICTSPRCGSTLVCKLLAATGGCGNPDSHFHNPSMSSWLQTYGLSRTNYKSDYEALKAVFDSARKRGAGDTGVFGLRLQKRSFDYFMQKAGILYPDRKSDVDRIEAAFGSTLFIHLSRTNKLDQAISYVKATQTGLWHIDADGTELERLSAPKEPFYDGDEIERQLSELSELDEAWNSWFERENLQPVRITYEELSGDPLGVLAKILEELGVDQEMADGISPPVAKLADATNRKWAERFLAERGKVLRW